MLNFKKLSYLSILPLFLYMPDEWSAAIGRTAIERLRQKFLLYFSREAKGDARDDPKSKKPKPSASFLPNVIGDTKEEKRTAFCRTWGKIRDEHCLFFFDDGARANFISPELAEKFGTRAEEMGPTCDANMANLEPCNTCHSHH